MVKAPQPTAEHQTLEKFREYVESLEIARSFIGEGSAKSRLGLIILDNLAEVLMYRSCQNLFGGDELASGFIPPKYSRKEKTRSLWEFGAKVEVLRDAEVLTEESAAILALAHAYRNPAFHRDSHNPASETVLAQLLEDVDEIVDIAVVWSDAERIQTVTSTMRFDRVIAFGAILTDATLRRMWGEENDYE